MNEWHAVDCEKAKFADAVGHACTCRPPAPSPELSVELFDKLLVKNWQEQLGRYDREAIVSELNDLIQPLLDAARREERERVLHEEFEPWRKKLIAEGFAQGTDAAAMLFDKDCEAPPLPHGEWQRVDLRSYARYRVKQIRSLSKEPTT